jgi:uncharacterized protein DUF1707
MTGAEQSPVPVSAAGTARAGDADREAVAEQLRVAAAEGRIDFEELDDRLGQALTAKTYGQLRDLVADLPAPPAALAQQDDAAPPGTLVLKTKTPNIPPQTVTDGAPSLLPCGGGLLADGHGLAAVLAH